MSEPVEDQDGAAQEVTEQPLSAWPEPAEAPAWAQIAAEAQPAASSSAEAQPAASSSAEPGLGAPAPADTEPGAGPRSRRPSSLRAQDAAESGVPRRRLAPPDFPGSPSASDSPGQTPVSESSAQGKSGQVPNPGSSLIDKLPIAQVKSLVRERPEVGLGLCFAGGLVIATLLKRLGR